MLEDKQTKIMRVWKIITKIIIICNMTCPQEDKIEEKRLEKRTNYRQLVFEIRERRSGLYR